MAGAALLVGILTLFSMTKIWGEVFWRPHPAGDAASLATLERRELLALVLPVAALAVLTVTIGLHPEPFLGLAERAAEQLLDPADYVRVVLGGPQ